MKMQSLSSFILGLLLLSGWSLNSTPTFAAAFDSDGDGMSDLYETFFRLNPIDTGDATLDPDGDGLSNLQESALWTDPHSADTDCDGVSDAEDDNAVSTMVIPWGDPAFTTGDRCQYTWPTWAVDAFKIGGAWNAESLTWDAMAGEAGALCVDLDRDELKGDVAMALWFVGGSGAVDLYDAEGKIVAQNVAGVSLGGSEAVSCTVYPLGLASHPDAVGVILRKDPKGFRVFSSVLFEYSEGSADNAESEQSQASGQQAAERLPVNLQASTLAASHENASGSSSAEAALDRQDKGSTLATSATVKMQAQGQLAYAGLIIRSPASGSRILW